MGIPDPIIGRKLGDYTIVELLGKGGMARVYKGYDEALDRYAAVKVITSDFVATADEEEYKERFQREARAIARLRHPNIVGVYQFNDLDGLYYMAMVFLDGVDLRTSLKAYIEKGEKMPHGEVLQMATEVASALDYAHSQGVIHRDIKPSNIMMTSTGATLTDFGLALSTMEGTAGDTFGSAHYIAPEQAISSARAVPQSDLYSLGVVLYEAFTGKVPFDDPSVMSVALKHLNEPPPRPTESIRDFPPMLEDVLMKLLAKEPADRHQSGAELIRALHRALPLEGETADMPESASRQTTGSSSYPALNIGVTTSKPSMTDAKKAAGLGGPPAQDAQDLINQKTEAKPAQRETKRRVPWVAMIAILLVLLLGGGAFLALSSNGDDDDSNGGEAAAPAETTTLTNDSETDAATATATETSAADETATAGVAVEAESTATASPTTAVFATSPTDTAAPTSTTAATVTPTETEQATDPATASATVTATDDIDDPTATTRPTETATEEPTSTTRPTTVVTDDADETEQPTSTATDANTATPTVSESSTAVAVVVPLEEDPDIELRYTETSLILENVSGLTLNLANLRFEGNESGRFPATQWSRGLQNVNAQLDRFRAGGCIQISTQRSSFQPMNCRWYNVWVPETLSIYHFFTGDNTTFSVYNNQTLVGLCAVEDGLCQFSLDELDLDSVMVDAATTNPEATAVAQVTASSSPTPTTTLTPTSSPTQRSTATELAAATEPGTASPDISLRYTSQRLLLENISGRTQNLAALGFENETGNRFSATEWNTSLRQVGASTSAYRNSGCVQVVTTPNAVLNRPCLRYNVWIQRNIFSSSYFWGSADSETFTVELGDVPIAVCPVNTDSDEVVTCEFSLSGELNALDTSAAATITATATTPAPEADDAPSTATAEASPTETEAAVAVELRYDALRLVLENVSPEPIDLSSLVFIGDENGQFSAVGWSNRLEDLDADLNDFAPGGCVQLVVETSAVLETPCEQYNIWIRRGNSSAHFWLDTEANTSFVVTIDETVIAECPIVEDNDDELTCRFSLTALEAEN